MSCWILKGVPHHPLCGCCAAQSNFAELHAHTARCPTLDTVPQIFLLRLQHTDKPRTVMTWSKRGRSVSAVS